MRIKIVSKFEGARHQARVLNAETGEELEGVISASIHVSANGCIALLELINFEADVEANVEKRRPISNDTYACPGCRKLTTGVLSASLQHMDCALCGKHLFDVQKGLRGLREPEVRAALEAFR